jgi:hypothetical protein
MEKFSKKRSLKTLSLVEVIVMTIFTTANIDKSTDRRICDAAELCGIKPRQIASILMKILIKEKSLEIRSDRTVEYQARRDKDQWKCFHLELTGAVYGASIDLRNLMKLSVSYLLSYAVEVYLERAVEEVMNGAVEINYPENYTLFIHHSPERSTFTVFHTAPDPEDYQYHRRSSA